MGHVPTVRRGHDHGIEVRGRQQVVGIRVGSRAKACRRALEPGLINVAHRGDLNSFSFRLQSRCLIGKIGSPAAAADQSDPDGTIAGASLLVFRSLQGCCRGSGASHGLQKGTPFQGTVFHIGTLAKEFLGEDTPQAG